MFLRGGHHLEQLHGESAYYYNFKTQSLGLNPFLLKCSTSDVLGAK